ncbi:MAG: hypothetical protein AAGJ87_05375 [Pseudomonadota bacterium]
MTQHDRAIDELTPWRRPAPKARLLVKSLYGWGAERLTIVMCLVAAAPFVAAAAFAPALLNLAPTVDMLTPVAAARAVNGGAADIAAQEAPFYLTLLLAADAFADAPGRIHLLAKAFGAGLVGMALAALTSVRFPAVGAVFLTAVAAAYVAAPFSGPTELALAVFLVATVSCLCAPAVDRRRRAAIEGVVAGVALSALWMLDPVFSLAGFIVLTACPFLSGRCGMVRYGATAAALALAAGAFELLAPGINMARVDLAASAFDGADRFSGGQSVAGLSGVAASAGAVLFLAAVFGGRAYARSWALAAAFLALSFVAARLAGANAWLLFAAASVIATFSTESPFYDGVFRAHDRASIAVAGVAAALTIFWTAALGGHAASQMRLQHQVAQSAPADIRSQLALVQPGGPTIATWIEEGRFSTPEARELFALAPVDQSAMLLAAAADARKFSAQGASVAILTGADTACVLARGAACHADGPAAASVADIVFVPRLDLDPATAAAKIRAEALLYTEFKLARRDPLWEVWLRRGSAARSAFDADARFGDALSTAAR